jgi:hypothetical protein
VLSVCQHQSVSEVRVSVARERPLARLVIALVAAAVMWGMASLALAAALVSPMLAFDDGARRNESIIVFVLASLATVLLYLGSGPVAYWIARRRWLLALPLIGLAVWGIGVLIAYAT